MAVTPIFRVGLPYLRRSPILRFYDFVFWERVVVPSKYLTGRDYAPFQAYSSNE